MEEERRITREKEREYQKKDKPDSVNVCLKGNEKSTLRAKR